MSEELRGLERLTAKAPNGMAYLVKVKPSEQEVESSYPNTLRCILESFNRLALYETHVPALLNDNARLQSELAEARNIAKAMVKHRHLPDVVGGPLIYPTFEAYNRLCDLAGVPHNYRPEER
jgi:hypothetical protein